ncbi:hypothetical protein TRFO_33804 [Tritrichomonas foetus]|uniref:Uncharacterized protein n=1 Tax=Tritrichomonas foetus TaxID=1144522 RepID=A0A1J4JQC0_9EUKA|nr:hypothetical protein TRFO_33804 [Tritrichomonas foetus]|eukprot:OHS99725.1 hypothetical protein TRFO_33804 [Tritrichomonas foetus]
MKQRPFCDQRPSMKTNVMLVRHKVGRVTDTTRDLPPTEYRYGYQAHDDHSVAECLKWGNPIQNDNTRRRSSSVKRRRSRSPSLESTYSQTSAAAQHSRNMRTIYDGYDPRNLDRSICSSKIDPEILAQRNMNSPGGRPGYDGMSDTSSVYSRAYSINSVSTARRPIANSKTAIDAISMPTRVKQQTEKKTRGKTDFIETNRQALRAGCVTASEYRDFKEKNDIFVKPEENFQVQEDEFLRYKQRQMVHGIPTPVSTEMKECLTWQGYKDAKAKALARREVQKARKAKKAAVKPKGIRHTRASRGESYKPDPPPSYADTYKIPRFRDIDRYAIVDYW